MGPRLIVGAVVLLAALAGCGPGQDPKADAAGKIKAAPSDTPKKPKSGDFE